MVVYCGSLTTDGFEHGWGLGLGGEVTAGVELRPPQDRGCRTVSASGAVGPIGAYANGRAGKDWGFDNNSVPDFGFGYAAGLGLGVSYFQRC